MTRIAHARREKRREEKRREDVNWLTLFTDTQLGSVHIYPWLSTSTYARFRLRTAFWETSKTEQKKAKDIAIYLFTWLFGAVRGFDEQDSAICFE